MRVLFVCLGNICRSPLGEGILRRMVEEQGLDIEIDSAGTGDYHIGDLPDHRARAVGIAHGCRMDMRARQVTKQDFETFDLIIAMDQSNQRNLEAIAGSQAHKIRLAMSFDVNAAERDVPDPYYKEDRGFQIVADMLESACASLLDSLKHG